MTRRIQVTFENGVLIPDEKINFPEHQKLTILVDEHFPDDPPPEAGLELLNWFSRHRIKIDPKIAQEIAESDEYLEQEPEDAA